MQPKTAANPKHAIPRQDNVARRGGDVNLAGLPARANAFKNQENGVNIYRYCSPFPGALPRGEGETKSAWRLICIGGMGLRIACFTLHVRSSMPGRVMPIPLSESS